MEGITKSCISHYSAGIVARAEWLEKDIRDKNTLRLHILFDDNGYSAAEYRTSDPEKINQIFREMGTHFLEKIESRDVCAQVAEKKMIKNGQLQSTRFVIDVFIPQLFYYPFGWKSKK